MSFDSNGNWVADPTNVMAGFKVPTASSYTLGTDTSDMATAYPTGSATTGDASWNFLSNKDQQGYGSLGLGAASGLFNAWLGMQQYGVAKDSLAASKNQFALNYEAQRTTTNADLQDRQAARVASNPTAYQSVGDYMAQNSVKAAT